MLLLTNYKNVQLLLWEDHTRPLGVVLMLARRLKPGQGLRGCTNPHARVSVTPPVVYPDKRTRKPCVLHAQYAGTIGACRRGRAKARESSSWVDDGRFKRANG